MQDFSVETRVSSDGSLTIKALPFQAGDKVQVIIRSRNKHQEGKIASYSLRGRPVKYIDPFGSVAEQDWDALK